MRVGVRQKFVAAVGVLMAAVLVVSAVAIVGLASMAAKADTLYTQDVATAQDSADLVAETLTVHESALYELATVNPAKGNDLSVEMDGILLPSVRDGIAALRATGVNRSAITSAAAEMEKGLQHYLGFRRTFARTGGIDASVSTKSGFADQIDKTLEGVVDIAKGLNEQAKSEQAVHKRELDATYHSTQRLLAINVSVVLGLGLLIAFALSRNLVPRIKQYSAFATSIAAGRPAAALVPRGADELTELGAALNDMVDQRARANLSQEQQTEFVEMLQVIGSEDEAHLLMQRHLQRSISAIDVLVLTRNNSANRLEAATDLPAGSEMARRLVGLEPNACAAVRLGRSHQEGGARPPLLGCHVCGERAFLSTCEPLLVSGEVIGSVLVSHEEALGASGQAKVKTTVAQASPMLANLRNLALAEFRASNDPLTGLPNKRATEDTLKRMVAQADRSSAPFSAAMLDLDHFKEINDRFGHGLGDEVLAAVGAAIKSCLRESDFAGRFGGEEFLVLLPDTIAQDAMQVAEKIRRVIADITVPGVERYISASLGVAALLEHAGGSAGLLRGADRAQYAAKAAGRNRVLLAQPSTHDPSSVPSQGTRTPDLSSN